MIKNVIINSIAFVVSAIAPVYLYLISLKFRDGLKNGFIFLAIGVFLALVIHSFLELLEMAGYLHTETLLVLMPVFVSIGSIMIIYGAYLIYSSITHIKKK